MSVLPTYEEAKEICKQHPLFRITEMETLSFLTLASVSYGIISKGGGIFDEHPEYRNLRGLTYVLDNDENPIASVPIPKMDSIASVNAIFTKHTELTPDTKFRVYEKFDGTMVSTVVYRDRFIGLKTKTSFVFLSEDPECQYMSTAWTGESSYLRLSRMCAYHDWTATLEWVHANTHTVAWPLSAQFILLDIRDNATGESIGTTRIANIAKELELLYASPKECNKDQLVEFFQASNSIQQEGLIVQLPDGTKYKLKTDWFIKKTRDYQDGNGLI